MECLGGTPHTLLSVSSFSSVRRGSYKDRANERGDKGMKLEGGGVAGLWTKGLRDQQKNGEQLQLNIVVSVHHDHYVLGSHTFITSLFRLPRMRMFTPLRLCDTTAVKCTVPL